MTYTALRGVKDDQCKASSLSLPLLAISLCVHLCVSLRFASVRGNPGDRNNYSNLFNHTLSHYSHRMNNSIVSTRVCVLFMLHHLKRASLLSLSNSRVSLPSHMCVLLLTWTCLTMSHHASCIKKADCTITSSSRHGTAQHCTPLSQRLFHFSFSHLSLCATHLARLFFANRK